MTAQEVQMEKISKAETPLQLFWLLVFRAMVMSQAVQSEHRALLVLANLLLLMAKTCPIIQEHHRSRMKAPGVGLNSG